MSAQIKSVAEKKREPTAGQPPQYPLISAGVSNSDQGFRSGNQQWNGQSWCPHYTFCCTGNNLRFPRLNTSQRKTAGIIFVLHPAGDVGVVCVPRSVGLLLLLPSSRHRLLRTPDWDNRPRPAGVQSPRVGPGDGGPGLHPRLREDPSVQLRLPGLRTHWLESNQERRPRRGKEERRDKKKKEAGGAFCVHPMSHPKTLQFSHHSGFREPGSTVLSTIIII